MNEPVNLALERALKERDEFLQKNPEMFDFQEQLDKDFERFGNTPYTNIQIIQHYLRFNLGKLERILNELNTYEKITTKNKTQISLLDDGQL